VDDLGDAVGVAVSFRFRAEGAVDIYPSAICVASAGPRAAWDQTSSYRLRTSGPAGVYPSVPDRACWPDGRAADKCHFCALMGGIGLARVRLPRKTRARFTCARVSLRQSSENR
jgi:hypothetical protein